VGESRCLGYRSLFEIFMSGRASPTTVNRPLEMYRRLGVHIEGGGFEKPGSSAYAKRLPAVISRLGM